MSLEEQPNGDPRSEDTGEAFAGLPAAPTAAGRASGVGLFAAGIALIWPLAYSPALYSPVWAPKFAIVIVVAAAGIPLMLRERSRAGVAATAFLAVATVATLLSDSPLMSLVGLWNWGTGWLLIASLVGAWAIGRALSEHDRSLVEKALLTSTVLIAVVALLQMTVNLTSLGLPLVFGRSTALQGNPVYLGGVLIFGLVLSAWRVACRDYRWIPGVVLIAAALAVAQGRVSLLVACLTPLALLRARGARPALVVALAVGTGWMAGLGVTLVSDVPNAPGRTDRASAEVAVGTYTAREGLAPRLRTWATAWPAIKERPLIGAGPGRFWAATIRHRTLAMTRFQPTQYYTDPHNFLVEFATTTGILGLAALLAWLGVAGRGAGGPLGLAAGMLLLMHLLQPLSAVVTPLAMLALGASTARRAVPGSHRLQSSAGRRRLPTITLVSRVAQIAGVMIGILGAAVFLRGQLALRHAYLTFDPRASALADRYLQAWPEAAEQRAVVAASAVDRNLEPDWDVVRRHLREATRRDPADPRVWARLGDFEQSRRNVEAAKAAYTRAQKVEPWSLRATKGLAEVAAFEGDEVSERYWLRRLELILSDE